MRSSRSSSSSRASGSARSGRWIGTFARIHTIIVIGLGISSVAFTLASFVQSLTESELLAYFGRQRMMRQIETLSGHTIVAGYGRVGALVCDELAAADQPFVVVEPVAGQRPRRSRRKGFFCVTGDATEEKTSSRSGHPARPGAGHRRCPTTPRTSSSR